MSAGPDHLTILYHRCGWHSQVMSQQELRELGYPWYCEWCRVTRSWKHGGVRWVTFHPSEKFTAYGIVADGIGRPIEWHCEAEAQ